MFFKLHFIFIVSALIIALALNSSDDIEKISLQAPKGMTRAEMYYLRSSSDNHYKAVLLLLPGFNGNGRHYLFNHEWREFALKYNLALVGISFASTVADIEARQGYYYPEKGSGQVLLDGLKKMKYDKLPIFLYGFSGGAHFTSRFVDWKPSKVKAWCAYGAAWWDKPLFGTVPGIVACGSSDFRLEASRNYFWDGRNKQRTWLWVALKNTNHSVHPKFEKFVRDYFGAILRFPQNTKGIWVNIYTRAIESVEFADKYPCATAWLPHAKLYESWLELHDGGIPSDMYISIE